MDGETTVTESIKEYKYAFFLRLLGNEVFNVGFSSSSDSGRWIALSLASISGILIAITLYGSKLLSVFA